MIPKTIHYCWFGGNSKNELAERCIASWKRYCPDYRIIEWNETNYDVHKHPFMDQAYAAKKYAYVSDYARIDILNQYGGIYLDTDVELIAGLDPFLQDDFYAGFETHELVAFGLGFGSVAGHPVLQDILQTYDHLEFVASGIGAIKISCPRIQTEALKKVGLVCNNQEQMAGDCHIYPSEVFAPMSFETGITTCTDRTVSIHHYAMSWFSEKEQRSQQKEWRLVQRFGPRWGKVISSAVTFPGKLAENARSGSLLEYIRFLMRKR